MVRARSVAEPGSAVIECIPPTCNLVVSEATFSEVVEPSEDGPPDPVQRQFALFFVRG